MKALSLPNGEPSPDQRSLSWALGFELASDNALDHAQQRALVEKKSDRHRGTVEELRQQLARLKEAERANRAVSREQRKARLQEAAGRLAARQRTTADQAIADADAKKRPSHRPSAPRVAVGLAVVAGRAKLRIYVKAGISTSHLTHRWILCSRHC